MALKSLKKLILPCVIAAVAAGTALANQPAPAQKEQPAAPIDLRVQAATDGQNLSMRFTWRASKDSFGLFHDLVRLEGGKWSPAGKFNEDRISLMTATPGAEPEGFAQKGCLATCHQGAHYVPAKDGTGAYGLDLWHWRGARSAPMGYAEDTFTGKAPEGGSTGMRKPDAPGVPPTAFVRKEGDRFRESMPFAVSHTVDGKAVSLPEFVFDPARNSGFYFLTGGKALSTPDTLAADAKKHGPAAQAAGKLQHGLVATGVNANALRTAELPAAAKDAVARQALAGGVLPKNVMFDYGSDQHDIASSYSFDPKTRTVTVTLTRALDTGSSRDANLAALAKGAKATMGAAIHDGGTTGAKHLVTGPFTVGQDGADVRLNKVRDTARVDWSALPAYRMTAGNP